jgi:hypothetical protein
MSVTYRVFWQVPQEILCIELAGDLSIDDFNHINQAVTDQLGTEATNRHVALVVDVTRPGHIPTAVAQLRETQTYVLRRDLNMILVAGSNKLLRLMMLLTFNLCRPRLNFFDTMDEASEFVLRKGVLGEK